VPREVQRQVDDNQLLLENPDLISGNAISFLDKYLLNGSFEWRINGELYRKLLKISRRFKPDSNMQKCKLGETYVPYNITKQLRERGIIQSRWIKPLSYRFIMQYPKHNDIDMYLRLVDENLKIYRCYINIYNWKRMRDINDFIFQNRILATFQRIDPEHRNIHIITMNHRNIPLMAERCKKHNILILPMNEHITIDFLKRIVPFENVQ